MGKEKMSALEKEIREDIGKIVTALSHFETAHASNLDRYLISSMTELSLGLNKSEKRKLELANELRKARKRKAFIESSFTVKELTALTGLSSRGVRSMIQGLIRIDHNNSFFIPRFQFDFDQEKYVLKGLHECLEAFPPSYSPIGKFTYFTKDNPRLQQSPAQALKDGKLKDVLIDIRGLGV